MQEVSKEVEEEMGKKEVMKRRLVIRNCISVITRQGNVLNIFTKAGYWMISCMYRGKTNRIVSSFDPFDMHQVNQCEVTGHR